MDDIAEILEKLTITTFDIGSSTWVDVTHINDPHSFYVRPYDHRDYLKRIEAPGDRVNEQDIQPHAVVVYPSHSLENMVRGMISDVDSSNRTCIMWALDYGAMDTNVSYDLLHKPKLDISIVGLAVHCRLQHCAPIRGANWTESTIQAMKSFMGDDKAHMVVKGKLSEQLVVDFYNVCPDGMSTLLALTGHTTMNYVPFSVNRFAPVDDAPNHIIL